MKSKNHQPCWSLVMPFLLPQIQHLRAHLYITFRFRTDLCLSFPSSLIPGIALFCHPSSIPLDIILFTFPIKSKKMKLNPFVYLCKHQMKGRSLLSCVKHNLFPPSTLSSLLHLSLQNGSTAGLYLNIDSLRVFSS